MKLVHLRDHVHELRGDRAQFWSLELLMHRPELVRSVGVEPFIVGIILFSFGKRWVTSVENEEDQTEREYVDIRSDIRAAGVNFRCHVALSAEVGFELAITSTAFDGRRKAKVCHLDVVHIIQKNVLRF